MAILNLNCSEQEDTDDEKERAATQQIRITSKGVLTSSELSNAPKIRQ